MHKKEAELLRPYFEAEMLRALATYEKKYSYQARRARCRWKFIPITKISPCAPWACRAWARLGVTFGYVVAMDSPSGRPPGTFHWASTMWHELSHVYVLNMTNFRVPRWFTEGLAVHEETAASPEWGDRLDPDVIMAIKDKKLLPVAELDRGFVHPTYPAQVVVSYFQAGKICDYINREWGWAKLLAMIHDFGAERDHSGSHRKGARHEAGRIRQALHGRILTPRPRTPWMISTTGEGPAKAGGELPEPRTYDDVIRDGPAIRDIYPDYVEAGNVYEFLADAYLAKGDKKAAMDELERYAKVGGRSPDTLKQLATLLKKPAIGRKPPRRSTG